MPKIETFLRMNDGTELFARKFSRASSVGTIVIVHGACEHSGRYDHVIETVVEQGWNVVAYDQRGHGRSSGIDTHVSAFHEYTTDLVAVCDHFELPPQTTVLIGHSMGGLVAIRSAQTFQQRFAAAVLTSPLLGVKVRIPYRTLLAGRILSWYAPETRFRSRLRAADNSRNAAVIADRKNDPLIRRSVTAGWYFSIRRAVKDAWKERDSVSVPMLILQAEADAVVSPEATDRWARKVNNASTVVVPEAYHDLLGDTGWNDHVQRILAWLEEGVPISLPFLPRLPEVQPTLGLIVPLRKAS